MTRNRFPLFFNAFFICILFSLLISCAGEKEKSTIPVIGFLDAFEDETLSKARLGFFDALSEKGFSEANKNIKVIYRNAQGDIPTLVQACDYFISEKVDLIATNTTISTITAVQKTKDIPVCMMVAPSPQLAGLVDKNGKSPSNLFGVFETLSYIDTSVALIQVLYPGIKKLGLIYNAAEPQSQSAYQQIQAQCKIMGMELSAQSVSNSSETQLVVESLINQGIQVFFAMPDNSVFASFESITAACAKAKIPVFTSEAGLVARGAVAAFGADMYLWGYQSGVQAANFLANQKSALPQLEMVKVRSRILNKKVANTLSLKADSTFTIF